MFSGKKEKIADKSNFAAIIAEILSIKKEAVYRRLRGDVYFTFAEIVTVSRRLDISLDNLAGMVSFYRSRPFNLHVQDYNNISDIDHKMTADYIECIRIAGDMPSSEFGFATSIIPLHFSLYHEIFYYLYILKWMYQCGDRNVKPFSEIKFNERQKKLNAQYLHEAIRIKYTYFIWDDNFLRYMLNDILYFYSVRLISDIDIMLFKKEIMYFLERMEKLAVKGAYDNGNRVDIFVSSLNFETTYYYLVADYIHVSMISAYCVGAVTSQEKIVCDQMKTYMQALKRTSTLISRSAEKERIFFFDRQRETVKEFFNRFDG